MLVRFYRGNGKLVFSQTIDTDNPRVAVTFAAYLYFGSGIQEIIHLHGNGWFFPGHGISALTSPEEGGRVSVLDN